MDYSPPGSSVPEVIQARTLEWVAMSSSRGVFLNQGLPCCLLSFLRWQEGSLSAAFTLLYTVPKDVPLQSGVLQKACAMMNCQGDVAARGLALRAQTGSSRDGPVCPRWRTVWPGLPSCGTQRLPLGQGTVDIKASKHIQADCGCSGFLPSVCFGVLPSLTFRHSVSHWCRASNHPWGLHFWCCF